MAVVLHGVGAGAFVENGFGLCDLAGFNFFNEVDLIEIINDVMVGKIDKLVCLSEVVDCNDIIAPLLLRPLTIFAPIKPAAPVTIKLIPSSSS